MDDEDEEPSMMELIAAAIGFNLSGTLITMSDGLTETPDEGRPPEVGEKEEVEGEDGLERSVTVL